MQLLLWLSVSHVSFMFGSSDLRQERKQAPLHINLRLGKIWKLFWPGEAPQSRVNASAYMTVLWLPPDHATSCPYCPKGFAKQHACWLCRYNKDDEWSSNGLTDIQFHLVLDTSVGSTEEHLAEATSFLSKNGLAYEKSR